MPVKFNHNKAINLFRQSGGRTKFPDSLKKVLLYAQSDDNIDSIQSMAYLLATAKAESDYSLQRWEADYLCGDKGVPYKYRPCEKALRYYASSSGKKNYYTLGKDNKGQPYFGRGLIQLTGKSNYKKYGDLIGVDLINDGDKALIPKNSYKIASVFLDRKRGSTKKSVFDYVKAGDFRMARIRVNGGTKGVDRVNAEYNRWLKVLENSNFQIKFWTRKKRMMFGIIAIIGLGIGGYYLMKKS